MDIGRKKAVIRFVPVVCGLLAAGSIFSYGTAQALQLEQATCRIAGTPQPASIALNKIASGFTRPVAMLFNPADKTEVFVLEQVGLIKRIKSGVVQSSPALDIRSVVNTSGNETGLLGMAFHPDFKNNRRVFLNYTTAQRHRTVISEFKLNANGIFDKASEKVILEIPQPYSNHNGGDIKFGPDGFLYIGTGDGGSANDPHNNSQNLSSLLGKMLRININSGNPYAIPMDNPRFEQDPNARREIYAYGLRNPWRYSFDRLTGTFWAADVGQNELEEIDIIEKGGNYGWKVMEGTRCFRSATCNRQGLILPVHEYPRSEGVSVTGGYVYRGSAIPALVGYYLFADYATGKIWALKLSGTTPNIQKDHKELLTTNYNISSFAEDVDGELYVLDHRGGDIYKIERGTRSASIFPMKLSETGCFAGLKPLEPAPGVIPYTVDSQLWSDGAEKTRFIALPKDTKVEVGSGGKFTFPEGAILIKNFLIPERGAGNSVENKITETRFLVYQEGAFRGYVYRWNRDLSDADYISDALHVPVTMATDAGDVHFNYYIPSRGDCVRCHPAASGGAAGFTAAHLNMSVNDEHGFENQLTQLARRGVFDPDQLPSDLGTLPTLVDPYDQTLHVAERARSWLHTNCATCHNPTSGTAPGNLDFRSHTPFANMNICDALPENGDLGITNGRLLVPGDADRSIAWVRVHSQVAGLRMPPIATSRRDEKGSQLIRDWINGLTNCAE